MAAVFTRSAAFYDAIYKWKDYEAEAGKLNDLIQQYKQSEGDTLLDVACGTGQHLQHLREYYTVEGLDLEPHLLKIAHERLPDIALHLGDMQSFDLGKKFDVVICLFSSIAYVKTVDALNRTLENFARHTRPGGVVVVEAWLSRQDIHERPNIGAKFVDEPELKIVRMSQIEVENTLSLLHFYYLVGTPDGVEYFTERHEMALFTHDEYLAAFRAAGLEVTHDAEGLMNRGLYIGTTPLS
jgi:ubiquinone/menaquinone biosynthesis C-methylase UbiE